MDLKIMAWKSGIALALAAALLGGNAGALFGWGEGETAEPGAPAAEDITCATYRDMAVWGSFRGRDSQGDALTFALAEEAKKGTVTIDGADFLYTPKENMTGTDTFTYVATDSAGHVSQAAKVTVSIDKPRSGVTYADMADNAAAVAAQHLAEEGVFTGANIGGQYYFEPDREVSRSEFLAMALETAGREVTAVTMTGFCDDEAIPTWAKAYAAAGVAEGIVEGTKTEAGSAFRGGDAITFNEAATVLDRVLGLEDVDLQVWYADREAVPSWAAQAVANMESVSVLAAGSFGSSGLEQPVTRADAARMLSAVRTLTAGEDAVKEGWFR